MFKNIAITLAIISILLVTLSCGRLGQDTQPSKKSPQNKEAVKPKNQIQNPPAPLLWKLISVGPNYRQSNTLCHAFWTEKTYRMKVEGGWIYRHRDSSGVTIAMVFVPDLTPEEPAAAPAEPPPAK